MSRLVRHLPQCFLIGAVRAYRLLLSPWLRSSCRFEPSCSAYSLHALQAHGAVAGTWMTVHRLLRCGPWCDGGHDPVPDRPRKLFPFLTSSSLDQSAERCSVQDAPPPCSTSGPHP